MDGLRCIGDGQYHRFGSFVCYSNIQSQGQIFNYRSYPLTHPVCQRIRIQRRPTIRTHLVIPSQPIRIYQCQASHHRLQTLSISAPSITPSPTNPSHYLSSHVHSTLLLNGPFNFRFDFSLFFLYKQTQNIPKDMPSTSRTTNILRWKSLQDDWITSSLPSTTRFVHHYHGYVSTLR